MSADGIPSEWYFITPPQNVSWNKTSSTTIIETYGTNNPYLNYGNTSLRSLTLGDALVEGFSDAKAVEDNIVQLEACMRMVIEEGSGYAAPYCWYAYAGGKSYGTFIITDVDVKEEMRDMGGKATRAMVDIMLQEVAPWQVASGADITTTAIQGSLSQEGELALSEQAKAKAPASKQDAAVANANSSNSGSGSGSGSGSNSGAGAEAGGAGATSESTGPERTVIDPRSQSGDPRYRN